MKDRFKNWNASFRSSQLYLALKAHRRLVLVVSLTMVAQTGLTLVQPWPIRMMIDHVVENPSHTQNMAVKFDLLQFIVSAVKGFFYTQDFDFLYKGVGILLAIHLINSILLYFQNISLSRLGQQVVLQIRKNLLAQMMALPQSFFEKAQTGDLTSRISKDTADTQDILESFITIFIRSVPTVIGILIVSFSIDWIYALTFVLVIPAVYWANFILTRRTKEAMRRQRRIEGEMASNVQEAFYYHKGRRRTFRRAEKAVGHCTSLSNEADAFLAMWNLLSNYPGFCTINVRVYDACPASGDEHDVLPQPTTGHEGMTIGLSLFRDSHSLTFPRLLILPFIPKTTP